MSIFRRRTAGDLERVRSEIIRLSRALDTHGQRTAAVEASLAAQPEPEPVIVDTSAADAAVERTVELTDRLDALAAQLAAQLTALDARITAVATELANQLGELGTDIDALQNRPEATPLPDGAVDELRDTQTRLANEQARYQIAFREDLARLAEQLRRPAR